MCGAHSIQHRLRFFFKLTTDILILTSTLHIITDVRIFPGCGPRSPAESEWAVSVFISRAVSRRMGLTGGGGNLSRLSDHQLSAPSGVCEASASGPAHNGTGRVSRDGFYVRNGLRDYF